MKLLAKSATSRYPSADDLRVDLRRFRDGLPVAAQAVAGAAAATVAQAAPRTSVQPTVAPTRHDPAAPRVVAAGRRSARSPATTKTRPAATGGTCWGRYWPSC
jgi:hypothetical protein